MIETETIPAPNKYVTHFNAVVGNYGEALIEDGQGSERHQHAAQSVDVLMHEYAKATELLDYVRFTLCYERIERAYMEGREHALLADTLATEYPSLAADIREFVSDLEAAHA